MSHPLLSDPTQETLLPVVDKVESAIGLLAKVVIHFIEEVKYFDEELGTSRHSWPKQSRTVWYLVGVVSNASGVGGWGQC